MQETHKGKGKVRGRVDQDIRSLIDLEGSHGKNRGDPDQMNDPEGFSRWFGLFFFLPVLHYIARTQIPPLYLARLRKS